jgi:ADP-ribosyl-[dinitrogen reductase] hydrolase
VTLLNAIAFTGPRPFQPKTQHAFYHRGRRMTATIRRYAGSLAGLASGDAVGTTVEFRSRGTFPPVTDMVGGGPFGLAPGQWTDDTSMALCLAESLLGKNGFDARDQMGRYLNWWTWGYLSSTGECFDIGMTVRGALERFQRTGEPYSGSTDPHAAGNGSAQCSSSHCTRGLTQQSEA